MENYRVKFSEAAFLLVTLLLMIGVSIIGLGMTAHVAILIALSYLLLFAVYKKVSWAAIHEALIEGVSSGIIPIFIFILIGALISVWISAGTIPTIMVLGFSFLSVQFFLPTVFLVCGIIGGAVGSSFTTISTIGIAFIGMGNLIGLNPAVTTGAIVSGAFFGNSISPLSDTANLSAAISGVDLFAHLKKEMKTVIPAALFSLGYFSLLGFQSQGMLDQSAIQKIVDTLEANFTISWLALLPMILLLLCAWKKIPAIPTLLMSIGLSVVLILLHTQTSFLEIVEMIQNGFVAHTQNSEVDALLSRGGIQSMMWSISLIFLALSLGGLLVKLEIIDCLLQRFQHITKTPLRLLALTMLSSIGINILIGEQYLSIILPGKSFKPQYQEKKIPLEKLSRALNDAGSAVNPLIPWGVSGVFIAGTLGVSTLDYFPYAIFCLSLPVISFLLNFFDHQNRKNSD